MTATIGSCRRVWPGSVWPAVTFASMTLPWPAPACVSWAVLVVAAWIVARAGGASADGVAATAAAVGPAFAGGRAVGRTIGGGLIGAVGVAADMVWAVGVCGVSVAAPSPQHASR